MENTPLKPINCGGGGRGKKNLNSVSRYRDLVGETIRGKDLGNKGTGARR